MTDPTLLPEQMPPKESRSTVSHCDCNCTEELRKRQQSDPDIPVDFNTFILSLSSSAFYHLGQAPHPDHHDCCVNLPMAKQTLDILEMLLEKTANNLRGEEERLLKEIIDNLEQLYQKTKEKCGC